MSLKQVTISKIDQIFNAPLLQHCGEPIEWPEAYQIVQVGREQFAESIQSDYWENTLRGSFNIISDVIIKNRNYRYFTESIGPLEKSIGDIIKLKISQAIIESVFAKSSLKKMISRTLLFIIRNHCYENEYWDVIQQSNTDGLIHVLSAGHLPCGYEGIYPNGRILAF